MKLINSLKKLSKKSKLFAGSLVAIFAIALPVMVYAGYGPNGGDRKIFDFSNPAEREGAFDGPRFNSYINTNVYGDERAFVDAKECVVNGSDCYKEGVAGGYLDQQPVEVGKEYIVRAYVHNIANPSINDDTTVAGANDGIGVAKNTRIRFELPNTQGVANGFTAQARISADNALPQMVYDTVDLRNTNQKFNVSYVPGSAYIFNASHTNGLQLSDDIMGTNGTLIGANAMDGIFPGCFEYSAFVVIRVKVTAPDLEIDKFASTVSMPKMTEVSEKVSVKRGENVSWRINYKNTGTLFADDVTIRDNLPQGLEIVPGSIKLTTALGTVTLPDTALGSGGVNVGDYTPEGNGVIRFTTKVNTDPSICELTNTAFVRAANVTGEQSDTAKIEITDCIKGSNPTYSCKDLLVTQVSDKTYRFTVQARAENGASAKNYLFNFGDNTTEFLTDKTVVEHTYNKNGNFIADVDVTFNLGDNKTATDANNKDCSVNVKVGASAPTVLPDTGASSLYGLFAGISIIGAVAHRLWTVRRVR